MTAAVYDARPVIKVDGTERSTLSRDLLMLAITEGTDGLTTLEMQVLNVGSTDGGPDFLYFDRAVLDFGAEVSVQLGAPDGRQTLFTGKITALHGLFPEAGEPKVTVLAEDGLQPLRLTRRTRSWEETTDQTVFQQIAQDHSLTPDIQISGPTHAVLAQVNQTDLQFLRERCRVNGWELWLDGRSLKVAPRTARNSEPLHLKFGSELDQFEARADLAHQRTSLQVVGWDVSAKEAAKAEATASALQAESSGLTTGPQLLQRVFGERKEQIVHRLPANDAEAQAIADGLMRERARRFLVGDGTANGNPNLRVGRKLQLEELGPLFSGEWYVTETRHQWDVQHGYKTSFRAEKAGI